RRLCERRVLTPELSRLHFGVVFLAASEDVAKHVAQLLPVGAPGHRLLVVHGHLPKTENGKADNGNDHEKDDGAHADILRMQQVPASESSAAQPSFTPERTREASHL